MSYLSVLKMTIRLRLSILPIIRVMICMLLFSILSMPSPVLAKETSDSNDDERKLLRTLRFEGNQTLSNGLLRTVTRTRTNREILGIPGATLWQSLHSISSSIGEPPQYLNRETVGRDIERLKAFYESNGFFSAKVDTSIVEFSPGRARVTFHIEEGEPSIIRTLAYSGLPDFDDDRLTDRFFSRSTLARTQKNDTTFTVNRRYSVESISRERNRIINFLRRHGYASVQRDSIRVFVKPDSENPLNLDLLVHIRPGRIHYFGDVTMNLTTLQEDSGSVISESISGEPWSKDGFEIVINIDEAARTNHKLLRQRILFKPGEQFDNDLYLATVNQLQSLQMLTIRQFSLSEGGGLPDYSQLYLPVFFELQTIPRHQIRTDFFIMQRLGLGAGAGIRYSNNNVFKNAQRLELGLNGSFEYITGAQTRLGDRRVLGNIEGNIAYSLPFFAFPFQSLNANPNFLNPRTQFQFSLAQVNQINFNINANFRLNMGFEANHSRTTKSFLDLIELEWFDATATPEFIENVEQNVTDPILVQRILEDFRPQFSSIFRYTFRYVDTHIIKRDRGHYLETSFELGGTIPWFIESFIIGRDSLQSSIPSFTLSGQQLSYSQFIKTQVDFRRYHPVGNRTVFAWRGFAGFAYPFGQNPQIPLNRRFFAGGANDIRGWNPLRLGPGDVPQNEVTINGGDVKLAGFLELRHTFTENFLSSNWIVSLFTDFGNIWYGPRSEFSKGKFNINEFYKQIAIGSGIGLRLDWDFLVFRIDLAYRMNEMGTEPGSNWWQRNFIHFGIGHSF